MHAREMHAHEIPAYKMHACEVCAHDVIPHEVYAQRRIPMRYMMSYRMLGRTVRPKFSIVTFAPPHNRKTSKASGLAKRLANQGLGGVRV